MKLLVIGGVAGGASAAAKARRINEDAEIIMFERGEYISFANCGLPYHVGEVITAREGLLVMTPEMFRDRTNIDARTLQEVTTINPEKKSVSVKNHRTGEFYEESYDKLIISTGSSPFRPPIKGADDPDVMVLWTMPDMDRIKERVDSGIKKAIVIGGGFIGVEVAENLQERGIETSLVELLPQVLPPLDQEMTAPLAEELSENGIRLYLNDGVTEIKRKGTKDDFEHAGKILEVTLKSGDTLETELVIMAVGVRPNNELAKAAGLEIGPRGGVVVNKSMETSNSDIYAVGDVVQITDLVMNEPAMIPLAGPANRQGRIAAVNVFGGKEIYKGSLGTSIVKIFDRTAAATGANEKRLKASGKKYNKLYINPANHASYYPGASMLNIKVLFDDDGYILGAQIVGQEGVDKRIDVLATAIRNKLTLSDLEELELAYAPPFGSAKDPINFIGFVGNNILRGDSKVVSPDEISADAIILDISQPEENACASIPGATLIPLGELRDRCGELSKDKEIAVYCKVGLRGYLAERILRSKGFNVKNISGGLYTWQLFNPKPLKVSESPSAATTEVKPAVTAQVSDAAIKINACGLQCPGPIVKVKNQVDKMEAGAMLQVTASDAGFMKDLPAWCMSTGNELLDIKKVGTNIEALVRKAGADAGISTTTTTPAKGPKKTTIVLFSNDLDKTLAAMIIATGFATLGHEVSIFFTFWGLNVLRKDNPPSVKKGILDKMFGFMMPRGAKKLALSKMHMMGMGTAMMKHVMHSKNVNSLPELMVQARSLGVKFLACEMAMDIMGLGAEELINDVEGVGVAHFAVLSEQSTTTLFI